MSSDDRLVLKLECNGCGDFLAVVLTVSERDAEYVRQRIERGEVQEFMRDVRSAAASQKWTSRPAESVGSVVRMTRAGALLEARNVVPFEGAALDFCPSCSHASGSGA